MSINGSMDKEDVVYIYKGILYIHKKQWYLAICNSMNGLGGYYAKWNKPDKEKQIVYDFTSIWNLKKQNKTNEQM